MQKKTQDTRSVYTHSGRQPVFIIVERAKIRGTPVMEKQLLPGLVRNFI